MIDSKHMTVTRPDRRRIRVLFDSPAAWPLFSAHSNDGIGGAELRAVTFARELAKRSDFDVHLLVRSTHRAAPQVRDRITVHFESHFVEPIDDHSAAWAYLRRWSDRLTGSVLKRIAGIPERRRSIEQRDYDVLCCFGVNNRTASLVRSARRAGRRAIVFLTSDRSLADIQLRGRRQRGLYGELGCLCRFTLQSADAVIVQNRRQQAELAARLGIVTRLIRNPMDLRLPDESSKALDWPVEPYVLWVGRADTFSKRADLCWSLARACPTISFVAIMNAHEPATFQQLLATTPANVRLIPFVPFDQIEQYFQRATLLINTSDAEGFPNAFLQAGKYKVPIVSLHADPDGMLSDHGGGAWCRGSMQVMQQQLGRLIQRGPEYERMATRVQQYTHQYHELRPRVDELVAIIGELTERQVAA